MQDCQKREAQNEIAFQINNAIDFSSCTVFYYYLFIIIYLFTSLQHSFRGADLFSNL